MGETPATANQFRAFLSRLQATAYEGGSHAGWKFNLGSRFGRSGVGEPTRWSGPVLVPSGTGLLHIHKLLRQCPIRLADTPTQTAAIMGARDFAGDAQVLSSYEE